MYLMLKIKIFKLQLLKNYTANPVNSTCSQSILSPSFREHCPIRGVFSKKINVKKNFTLIGRSDMGHGPPQTSGSAPNSAVLGQSLIEPGELSSQHCLDCFLVSMRLLRQTRPSVLKLNTEVDD